MATYELVCDECGKPFIGKRRDRRFCKSSCAQRTWWRALQQEEGGGRWDAAKQRRREYHAANREAAKERFRRQREADPDAKKRYKHNCDDWIALLDGLWDSQDGKCYLCGDELDATSRSRVRIDHDHSCCPVGRSCEKCRRGLACNACNVAIGYAQDDPGRLRRLADNLEGAKLLVRQRLQEADWEKRGILFDLDGIA